MANTAKRSVPKRRTTKRRTGQRRSHLRLKLARAVNSKSPIKAFTTSKESGKAVTEQVKNRSKSE